MKCSVFIATSADGYIATPDGRVDWLDNAGKVNADMRQNTDMGFAEFINSVDCMIMGRKCMAVISSFNIPAEQWPYRDINALVNKRSKIGLKHDYIDGGTTIISFINLKLINEMTITRAPLLLGDGLPLFGKINHSVKLEDTKSVAFPNDFIQVNYRVNYL